MGPPKPRERFNAKARQSSVGTTHKKRKQTAQRAVNGANGLRGHNDGTDRSGSEVEEKKEDEDGLQEGAEPSGSNALIHDPAVERVRREADKKRRELLALADPEAASAPISSKKRKRLDAFIARQLKKEKRQQLIADLAKSSAQVGDRSAFVTAATLGTGRAQTGQDRLDQETAREERVLSRHRAPFSILNATDGDSGDYSEASDESGEHDDAAIKSHDAKGSQKKTTVEHVSANPQDDDREARIARARALFGESGEVKTGESSADRSAEIASQGVGSALALGPDGKLVLPVMRKKKQKKKRAGRKTAWGRLNDAHSAMDEASGGSDFNSSASSDGVESDKSDGETVPRPIKSVAHSGKSSSEEAEDASDLALEPANPESDAGDSDDSASTGDYESDSSMEESGIETDEEEQAILEEVMRLRGLLGNPHRLAPTEADYAASDEDDLQSRETSGESYAARGYEMEGSKLPFTTFEDGEANAGGSEDAEEAGRGCEEDVSDSHDDENSNESASQGESISASDDGVDSDEEDDDDDDDDDEMMPTQQPSRRQGLTQTPKSLGFKDWAKSALGLTRSPDMKTAEASDDDTYRGPEPVAGLTQKVGELGDGTIRGPLGGHEPTVKELSAFAQKHYEELRDQTQDSNNGPRHNHVRVERNEELQEARLKLPVLADEEVIVRTIMENMITILCGETGSGKTTQVPQFLLEAGFGNRNSSNPGMIGITQPRRVAALSMAARVGHELGLGPDRVSHQIRYDATVSPATSIKFMTDGVLLRELALDFLLEKYSVIIIDEAHERSVNTDVLVGVLSRVIKVRAKRWLAGRGRPLRMVIMSATLRVDDFAGNPRLFDVRPPILQVEARQYPVVTHFSRRTHHDYVEETVKKACKIHARLPPGGILIFLTGQAEIATVCSRLEKRFGKRAVQQKMAQRQRARHARDWTSADEDADNTDTTPQDSIALPAKDGDVEVEEIDLTPGEGASNDDLALDVDDASGFDDNEALETDDEDVPEYDADLPQELRDDSDVPMHILPLYSLLPSDRQMQVFSPPPENSRLVVVATNIAETSLTIPGISYVVDSGRSKERKYDATNGVQSFEVGFISKASANQRAGRAGRTGPGHCYRLYSSNLFEEHMPLFAEPEILRTPVDNLVLMMKSMNIDNVANFPFPTPPEREVLRRAEKLLLRLGALENDTTTPNGQRAISASQFKISSLGRAMSLFPLSTRLSKLLVQGHQHGCLPLVVALVAALSVGDPFVREESLHDPLETAGVLLDGENELSLEAQHIEGDDAKEQERRRARRSGYHKALNRFAAMSGALSDPLRLLSAVGAYEHEAGSSAFCQRNFLVPKTMEEIHKLRSQIAQLVRANAAPGTDVSSLRSPQLALPTAKQLTVLRQFLTAAFIDQIAIRADLAPESAAHVSMLQGGTSQTVDGRDTSDGTVSRQFLHQQRHGAKMQSTRNVAYLAAGIPHEACFIHRSSVLFHQNPPEWVVFMHVMRSCAKGEALERQGRNWLKGVTVVNANWIYKLGPALCSLSKPIEVDQHDSRARLIQAAQHLKRRQQQRKIGRDDAADRANPEKVVHLVPSYGTGPAIELSERSSHVGWELPPITAKQRLVHGKWITELT